MSALYHPDVYDRHQPVDSHWARATGAPVEGCEPRRRDAACDVAIIGAGYTGLSAALHLAREAGVEVVPLEACEVGWGASGRNGGFCCLGSHKLGNEEQQRRFGRPATVAFFRAQQEAVALVRELIR